MSIANSKRDPSTQRLPRGAHHPTPTDPEGNGGSGGSGGSGDPLPTTTLQNITEAQTSIFKGALRLLQKGTKDSLDPEIPTKTEAKANFGQQISRILDDNTHGGNLQSQTLKKTMTDLLVSNNIAANYNAMKLVAKGGAGTLEHSIKRFNKHMGNPCGDTDVHGCGKFLVNNGEEVSVQKFITENMHVLDNKIGRMLKNLKVDITSQQSLNLWKANEAQFANVKTFLKIGDVMSDMSKMNRMDSLAQVIEIEENEEKLQKLYDTNESDRKDKLRIMILKDWKQPLLNLKQKRKKEEAQEIYFQKKENWGKLNFRSFPEKPNYSKDENLYPTNDDEVDRLLERPPGYKDAGLGWLERFSDLGESKLTEKKFVNIFDENQKLTKASIKQKMDYYDFYVKLSNKILTKLKVISQGLQTKNNEKPHLRTNSNPPR